MKKNKFLFHIIIAALLISLTGCGKTDKELEAYKSEMEAFSQRIAQIVDSISMIDVNSDSRAEELLGYLDELNEEFANMGNLEVPEQFTNVEELADDASANLNKSVSLYHQAFDNSEIPDESILDAALEYYNRAFKRIEYIGTILQGQLPDDESVIIVNEGEETGNSDDAPEDAGGEADE